MKSSGSDEHLSVRCDYTFDFLSTGSDDDDDDPKIFFKSTKNLVSNSQWVGDHRYTRILCASKLLWV